MERRIKLLCLPLLFAVLPCAEAVTAQRSTTTQPPATSQRTVRSVDDDACDVLELSTTTEPHGVVGNFHAMRIADPNAPPAPRSFT